MEAASDEPLNYELRATGGDEAVKGRVAELRQEIAAIDAGLLRRALFLARRP